MSDQLAMLEPRCACSPRGLEPTYSYDGRCWRCGAFVVWVPPETADQLLREHGR